MNTYHASIDGEELLVSFGHDGSPTLAGKPRDIHITRIDQNIFSLLLDGKSVRVIAHRNGNTYQVLSGSARLEVTIESERSRLLKLYSTSTDSIRHKFEVHAPMPALVVKLEVKVGDDVVPGRGLIVLEAMKMENEIKAHLSGRVKEIYVTKGKPVEKGELLILLE